jgi:fibronectin-binding autotransporter adhesin
VALLPTHVLAGSKQISGSTGTPRVWGDSASWTAAGVPLNTDNVVIAGTGVVNLSGSAFTGGAVTTTEVQDLTFNGTGALTLRNDDAAQNMTLVLSGRTTSIPLISTTNGQTYTIQNGGTRSLSLQLLQSGEFSVFKGGTLNVASNITQDATPKYVDKRGRGNLVLSGTNSFTGGLFVSEGKATLTGSLANNSTVTVGSIFESVFPTFDLSSSVLNTYTVSVTAGGTFNLTSTGRLGNSSVVNVTGSAMRTAFANIASTTGSVFTTNINGFSVARVTGSVAAGSTINVNSGGLLTGNGTVNGSVVVSAGGTVQAGNNGVGNLTISALTFGSGASTIRASGASRLNVTTLTANGGTSSVTVNAPDISAVGVFPVIDYAGSIGGAGFGAFVLGALPNRTTASLLHNTLDTRVDLNVTSFDFPIWSGAGIGEWQTGVVGDWRLNSNSAPTDFQAQDVATFTDTATNTNVSIDTDNVFPSSVVFSNATKNYSITGASASFGIAGTGGLTKNNAGRVAISTPNSFTGPVTINGGTLAVESVSNSGAPSALGAGTDIFINGATLEYTGFGGESTNRPIALNASGATIKTTNAAEVTISGAISGAGTLTKTGIGTLILTGENSYGNTVISQGKLQVGDTDNFGTLGEGTTVTNNGELIFDLPSEVTVLQEIVGTGLVRKRGTASLTVAGATANTYSGGTFLESGVMTLSKTSGNAIPGNLTISAGGALRITAVNQIADSAIVTIDGGQFGDVNDGNTLAITDTFSRINLNSGSFTTGRTLTGISLTDRFQILDGTAMMHRGGVMTSARVDVSGPGEIIFDGGSTTAGQESKLTVGAGGLNLTGATLRFNTGNGSISTVGATSVGSVLALGGTLTANGVNQFTKEGVVTPKANLDLSGGIRIINTPLAGDVLRLGTLESPIAVVNGGITKNGDGTLVLEGAQLYSQATAINGGKLQISGALSTSSVSVAAGAMLAGTGSTSGAVTVASGGAIDVGLEGLGGLTLPSLIFNGTASVGLTRNSSPATINVTSSNGLQASGGPGSVALLVTGVAPAVGQHVLIDYVGSIGGASGFSAFTLGLLPNRVTANLVNDVASTQIRLNVTAADNPVWSGAASTVWSTAQLAAPKNWVLSSDAFSTTDFVSNDVVVFNDSAVATDVTIDGANVLPAAIRFENITKAYNVTGSAGIGDVVGGTTAFVKNGAGTVNLFVTSSFSGTAQINAGRVGVNQLGDKGLPGALGSGSSISLGAAGTSGALDVFSLSDRSDKNISIGAGGGEISTNGLLTLNGVISGSGQLTKTGTGTLELSGANSAFSPAIRINDGALRFFNAAALGVNSKQVILNGGTLEYSDGAKLVFSDASTPRTVVVTSAGGGITVTTGDPGDGGGLWFSQANALSGSGPLLKKGPATLRLTASNSTLTSAWTIDDGAVEAGLSNSLGTGSVTVLGSGLLVSKNISIANPITLRGGALATREGDSAIFSGPIAVLEDSFVQMNSFVAPATQFGMTLSGVISGNARLETRVAANTAASSKVLSIRNNANTFSGTFALTPNQTLLAQSATNVGKVLGTASVEMQGATLRIRDNGTGSNGNLAYGNNVVVLPVTGAASTSTIDIASAAATSGNVVRFGGLTINAETPTATTLNFNASSSYSAAFDGASNLTGTVTLTSSSSDLQFNGALSGDAAITFNGASRALRLSNPGNSFSGSFFMNASSILRSQPSSTGNSLGTASVRLASASLQIRDNGTGSNQSLTFGNSIALNAGSSTIDVSRVDGGNTGNTIRLGGLNLSASSTLNVTSSSQYKLAFEGPTTLGGAGISFANTAELELNGAISGTAGFTKNGTGRLLLNATNLFTGGVIVNAGTLGGDGSIGGTLNIASASATLAPGRGAGVFSVQSNVSFATGADFSVDLGRGGGVQPVPGEYDQLRIGTGVGSTSTGSLTLNNADLVLNAPGGLVVNDLFFIMVNDGIDPVSGTFAGRPQGSNFTVNGYEFTISYTADFASNSMSGGNDVALLIPEPTGVALMLGGLATLLCRRRRNS